MNLLVRLILPEPEGEGWCR